MDPQQLQPFLEKAEDRVAAIRGSLLLFPQGRLSVAEISQGERKFADLKAEAESIGLMDIAGHAAECSTAIELVASANNSDRDTYLNNSLDMISRLEAALLQMPLGSDDFLTDVNDLVDASFEHFKTQEPGEVVETGNEDFEVDDETLEIFRSEAEGLLANISTNLKILSSSPDDSNALWEIRRNAHTFKGAAGIIGFREASKLAHRVEDLLDKMVESRCGADSRVLELLSISTGRLVEMVGGKLINDDDRRSLSRKFDKLIESVPTGTAEKGILEPGPYGTGSFLQNHLEPVVAIPAPVVRVSLDRLDDLLNISQSLLVNRSALAERFAEFTGNAPMAGSIEKLEDLIETQRRLSDELQQRLLQIRMVRFGTLEMRLNRAVHVTCQEEGKKAIVTIQNADLEIDTLVIDALIEPLLHLLKNAVVHGIEPPETRRLLGKPEQGGIFIAVTADENEVSLSVEDDGRGISTTKLIEKAVASDIVDIKTAAAMDEASIFNLIFQRGLTTADSLNLNAGRGVGMSIVKESVECRGGSVTIESEQQQGTKFTIRTPLTLPKTEIEFPESIQTAEAPGADMPPLILIVDDSQSIRRMTAQIVEDAGFRSISADSGAEALELLLNGEWEPDLILSDVEMPVMDGWEFLEYVKTDENLGHIPVVMVTSLDPDKYRQKAIDLGASDYLVKPFGLAELERVCEKLAPAAVS